jgi:hypothetical protein
VTDYAYGTSRRSLRPVVPDGSMSVETRRKISDAMRGRRRPPEVTEKMLATKARLRAEKQQGGAVAREEAPGPARAPAPEPPPAASEPGWQSRRGDLLALAAEAYGEDGRGRPARPPLKIPATPENLAGLDELIRLLDGLLSDGEDLEAAA